MERREPSSSAKTQTRRLDGEQNLLAMLCSPTPEEWDVGLLRLLAEQIVQLGYVESVFQPDSEADSQKTDSSRGLVILGDSAYQTNAEVVCQMEDVLDVYTCAYDPHHPVVCFDESNKQLLGEKIEPFSMQTRATAPITSMSATGVKSFMFFRR